MMIKPGISELSKLVESRYILVSMAAKRARMIGTDSEEMLDCNCLKPVSKAVDEIASGKVGYIPKAKRMKYIPNKVADAVFEEDLVESDSSADKAIDDEISEEIYEDQADEALEQNLNDDII